jgi:hypothetical protein
MSPGPASRSHEHVAQVLRRAGFSAEVIRELLGQLPDPIDFQRDEQILARYGVGPEQLMNRLGGSP